MAHTELPIVAYTAIRNGSDHATEDAIRAIMSYLEEDGAVVHRHLAKATNRFDPQVLDLAPTSGVNNLDYLKSGVLHFSGASSVNLTGIIAPEAAGAVLILHNTGSGTITVVHQSASSDVANRIVSASGANRSLATNNSMILCYLGGFWRDISFQ